MYHTIIKNQVSYIKKSTLTTGFAQKDLQTSYSGDIDAYIASCTPFQQDVASIFLKFRNAPSIKITNSFIAKYISCSTRTVTRSTNKFHKDGFITKHQPHQYSTNHYTLNDKIKKGTYAFSHWLNSLSSENKDLYVTHGIIIDHKNKIFCSDVIPNYSSLILESLSRRPGVSLTHARARRQVFLKKLKGKTMNSVQKQLILRHRSDPRIKEILQNPNIRSEIITSTIQKISSLAQLDEKEQFKLTAFSEEALEHVLKHVEPIVAGSKQLKFPVKNRMEWLISLGNEFCKQNNTKPDWSWYYDLCDMTGISTQTEPKPLVVKKLSVYKKPAGIYAPWKAPQQPPRDIRIEKLRSELKAHERNLENNVGPVYMMGILRRAITQIKQELAELEEQESSINQSEKSNEKQSVSYQYNSNTLAAHS